MKTLLFTKKRIVMFVGGYGSGKTEVAVNYTLRSWHAVPRLSIADLDIVNPYFRSREQISLFAARGIDVIAPAGGLATADLPALPPQIRNVLVESDSYAVFDIGGDDVGARVLGQYRHLVPQDDYEMWFVLNICRPFSQAVQPTVELLRSIEATSRLKVTGLVNNSNLMRYTDLSLLRRGEQAALEVAEVSAVPLVFNSVVEELAAEAGSLLQKPILPMHLHMKRPWE